MESKMPKCKVTVLKRTLFKDLIEEYAEDQYKNVPSCEIFKDGQEFIIDPNLADIPEDFCHWAWADIRDSITLVASGGNVLGFKNKGTVIAGCSDWFRPVIFKIERLE
jgi:uncharacterized repeat protein (TIGR04076 family)